MQAEVPKEPDSAIEEANKENGLKATEPPLNSTLQSMMGLDPSKSQALKLDVHADLISHLHFLVLNGAKKEDRENLLMKYEIPKSFAAPLLNEQLQTKLGEKALRRDSYRVDSQKLVSVALIALGAAITQANAAEDEGMDEEDFKVFMERLTDATKAMADVQN